MESNIFKDFANSFFQNDIVRESSRQPPDVQKILMVVSPPQCFECDTPSLKENTSANISQKENDFSIDLNKKN